jgi:hypothetical protein
MPSPLDVYMPATSAGDRGEHEDKSANPISEAIRMRSNENKMSDGGRGRTPVGVGVWKSSQKWSVPRSAVRSIAWLDVCFIGVHDNIL